MPGGMVVVDSYALAAAMCGFRIPATTRDTSVTDAQLLSQAKKQSRYRADWRYKR
jgi:hypothetical protein